MYSCASRLLVAVSQHWHRCRCEVPFTRHQREGTSQSLLVALGQLPGDGNTTNEQLSLYGSTLVYVPFRDSPHLTCFPFLTPPPPFSSMTPNREQL